MQIDTVIGVESRGFIFATPLLISLAPGLSPFASRKNCRPNASRYPTISNTARTRLKCTRTRSAKGHSVLIVDDLLATGGTARAVVDLVESVGGKVAGLLFVVELDFLGGRANLTATMSARLSVTIRSFLTIRYSRFKIQNCPAPVAQLDRAFAS